MAHIFSALNYDHPFVYVYDTSLPYSKPTSFGVWLVYALGAVGVRDVVSRWLKSGNFENGSAIAAFVSVTALMTLATISLSAVESRFSTLILAALGVFAVYIVFRPQETSRQRYQVLGFAMAIAILGTVISEWMKTLVTTVPPT